MSDKDYENIDISRCEDCPFYEEFGAVCKMYSDSTISYGIDMCYDRCLYRKLKAMEEIILEMDSDVYCSNCARVQKKLLEIIGEVFNS